MVKIFNTFSNLAYILVGVMVWALHGFNAFVIACFLLGIGSGLFHWYHDHEDSVVQAWTHLADEVGMYTVFSTLLLLVAGALTTAAVASIWATAFLAAFVFSAKSVLTALGAGILTIMIYKGLLPEAVGSVIIFLLAYHVRQSDKDPDHGKRHAPWHVLTAILIFILYFSITP